jgi:hypothetical protein
MTRTRQGVCLAIGMLCALGILSAIAVRAEAAPHHHPPAMTAVAPVADGHGTTARADHNIDLPARAAMADAPRPGGAQAGAASDSTSAAVRTVRTRGPPAAAA